MGVGSSEMLFLTQFISNRPQYVVVDRCSSKLVNVISGVPQRSVLGPQLLLLYSMDIFSILKNMLYGYAGNSTLVAIVPCPGERVVLTESLNRDLNRVHMWCDLWGMKSKASKTKTMIVPRSCTIHHQSSPLTLDGTVLKQCAGLVILGMMLMLRMTIRTSSLHFHSCSSESWYHEKVLISHFVDYG